MNNPLFTIDISPAVKYCEAIGDSKKNIRLILELAVLAGRNVWTQAVTGRVFTPMTRPLHSMRYAEAINNPVNTTMDNNKAVIKCLFLSRSPDY